MCRVILFVTVQDTWSKMQADGVIKIKSIIFKQEQINKSIKYLEHVKKPGKEARHIGRQHMYKPAKYYRKQGCIRVLI